ncbi:MAG: ABC transporter substrate-binding protein [Lachnospiraceae bacterium]|nr:ABC transporter substrate-binding protein [Lachnospiraceae bacterium]
MKKFKKALSLMLAAAMVLSLAACGGSDKGGSKDEAKSSGEEVFKIGGIGPITGANASYGLGVKNGAQIAVDEINAAGGINGYKVEYKFEDDVTDNEKSVHAYNTLKDWGMQLLMGSTTSTCSITVSAKSSADNMFQLTPSGSAVDCVATDNAFQVCFTDPNQGVRSAQYIAEHKMATKIAGIYDSSDTYSSGIWTSFKKEAANQGIEIVAEGAFTADNKTDFSVQLQQAKDAGAEMVFMPIYFTEAALILAQADAMGFAPQFVGCDGMDGILTVKNFDTSLAEGLVLLTPFAATAEDELTQKYVETYKKNYNEIPNQFSADAYDAIYIMKAAIEKADLKPSDGVSAICDGMKAVMTEINVKGLTSDEEGMTWTEGGEVSKAPKAAVIKNGEYVMAQ